MDFLIIDNTYNSLFSNMCNINYEVIFILKNKYNIHFYFFNYINFIKNIPLNNISLIYNNYNIYYFKFYIIFFIKNINKIEIHNNINITLNFYIKYNIINKLPKLPVIFYFINYTIDNNIFPNKNTYELYFFFKKPNLLNLSYNTFNYLNINNHNLVIWKKGGIINYLILNNIYLLPLTNNWYGKNFLFKEYLYLKLPFYWDYDYILGINKYLNYFNIDKIFYFNIINQLNIIFNIDLPENHNYSFLNQLLILFLFNLNKLFINSLGIGLIYIYLIQIYIHNLFNILCKTKNLNILILHNFLWIEDYTFFYFFNPLYLYIGKKTREIINWYIDLINKKNLIIPVNNKYDKDIIFYFDFIFYSYIKYITFLLNTLIIKYIYNILLLILYNIKFVFCFFFRFINLVIKWNYSINYLNLYNLKLNYIININFLKKNLNKINYIYLNWINFTLQYKLAGNEFFINLLNFIKQKELDSLKFNNILNQKEYYNQKFFNIINNNISYINLYFSTNKFYILNKIKQISLTIFKYKINKLIFNLYIIINLKHINLNKLLFLNIISSKTIYTVGFILYYFLRIITIILSKIYIYFLKIFFNFKFYLFLLTLIIMYILNWDINIIWLIIDNIIYEFNINNFYNNLIYNNLTYNINEWAQYKINFIIETIKLNINFMQTKQEILDNLFININVHKKKWQNVTNDKIWNFLNPIYLLIFLIYELQIQWFINELFNYIKVSIIIYIYINYLPFLYWTKLNYIFNYWVQYLFKYISYLIYCLKCYYTYIYIYILPNYINKLISKLIFNNFYKLIFLKLNLIKLYNHFSKVIAIILLNLILKILVIFKYFYRINLNLYLIILIVKLLYHNLLNNLYNINEMWYYNFYTIYIFINSIYKIQNNIDILYSYLRLNKNKIYKWNKFSKRKKTFRIYLNSFLIEQFYSLTYNDNIITLSTYIKESSLLRFNIIDNLSNANIYIKYFYITSNYFNNLINNIIFLNNLDYKYNVFDINIINEGNFQFNIIYSYNWYWNIYYSFFKKNLINIIYYNILEDKFKLLINKNQIYNKVLIYLLFLLYLYLTIIFLTSYNNKYNMNNEYLWKKLNKKGKKNNNLFLFNKILNKWLYLAIKEKSKPKKFIKYIYNNIISTNENSSKLYFFIKFININKKFLYNLLFINKLNYWTNLKNFQFYTNIYNKNNSLITLLCLLMKKNKYTSLIIKQEINSVNIPLGNINYIIQKKININIWLYFNFLNNKLLKTWALNKSQSTIFTYYREGKSYINIQLYFPYEKNYFIFIILFLLIYYKIIIFNITWNQKYWIGSSTYDKQVFFNFLINNIFSNNLTWCNWQYLNTSLLNSNSNIGIIAPQYYIYIFNNKFYNIYKLWEYNNIKINNISNINFFSIKYYHFIKYFILIIYLFLIRIGIKFIYKKYISKFFNLVFKNKLNIFKFKFNIRKFKFIFLHYKFKKMLFNKNPK